MQIVIEISDRLYKAIQERPVSGFEFLNLVSAVRKGMPLPKGHGGLIDRNEIEYYTDCNGCYGSELGHCCDCMEEKTIAYIDDISNLNVLVPADKDGC